MSSKRTVQDLKDELMIYEPDLDLIHFLNPTARRIRQLHREGLNKEHMEAVLRREFDIPASRDVKSDIQACVEELRKKDLLED